MVDYGYTLDPTEAGYSSLTDPRSPDFEVQCLVEPQVVSARQQARDRASLEIEMRAQGTSPSIKLQSRQSLDDGDALVYVYEGSGERQPTSPVQTPARSALASEPPGLRQTPLDPPMRVRVETARPFPALGLDDDESIGARVRIRHAEQPVDGPLGLLLRAVPMLT